MRQNSIMQPTYLHKSGPKTHHASSFTNTLLKNNKFTASSTEIGSIMYHNQTFNHKNASRKNVCVCVWGGGGGGRQGFQMIPDQGNLQKRQTIFGSYLFKHVYLVKPRHPSNSQTGHVTTGKAAHCEELELARLKNSQTAQTNLIELPKIKL